MSSDLGSKVFFVHVRNKVIKMYHGFRDAVLSHFDHCASSTWCIMRCTLHSGLSSVEFGRATPEQREAR